MNNTYTSAFDDSFYLQSHVILTDDEFHLESASLLTDQFQKERESGHTTIGVLNVDVEYPSFATSINSPIFQSINGTIQQQALLEDDVFVLMDDIGILESRGTSEGHVLTRSGTRIENAPGGKIEEVFSETSGSGGAGRNVGSPVLEGSGISASARLAELEVRQQEEPEVPVASIKEAAQPSIIIANIPDIPKLPTFNETTKPNSRKDDPLCIDDLSIIEPRPQPNFSATSSPDPQPKQKMTRFPSEEHLKPDKQTKAEIETRPPLLLSNSGNRTTTLSPSFHASTTSSSIGDGISTSNMESLISQLAEMDLHTDETAFREWLKRKKKQGKIKTPSRVSSPLPPHSANSSMQGTAHTSVSRTGKLYSSYGSSFVDEIKQPVAARSTRKGKGTKPVKSFETEEELYEAEQKRIKEFLEKREKSEKVFRAWLERKENLMLDEELKAKAEVERLESKKREEEARKMDIQKRADEAVAAWKAKKREQKEREEAEIRKKEEMEQAKVAEKRQKGERAFEDWRKKLKERPKSPVMHHRPHIGNDDIEPADEFYNHSAPWRNILENQNVAGKAAPPNPPRHRRPSDAKTAKGTARPTGLSKSPSIIPRSTSLCYLEYLSPPLLYRERTFYENVAPDYVRKYGVLVASGGQGLPLGNNGLAQSFVPIKRTKKAPVTAGKKKH
ncbi:hypothetical protein HDU97_004837 [Phlyctochytrium planicorne]|nr:hypothetical protein HDU97_004837 [Phlyctochytrium planicorne]